MDEDSQKLLQQVLLTILGSVLGGVLAACVGLHVFRKKRIRDAKDDFLGVISQKLGAIDKQSIATYYEKTKPEIREAVFRLRPILNLAQRADLNLVWVEYDSIIAHEVLKQENESDHSQAFSKAFPDNAKPSQKPSDILINFYIRFEKAVD